MLGSVVYLPVSFKYSAPSLSRCRRCSLASEEAHEARVARRVFLFCVSQVILPGCFNARAQNCVAKMVRHTAHLVGSPEAALQ